MKNLNFVNLGFILEFPLMGCLLPGFEDSDPSLRSHGGECRGRNNRHSQDTRIAPKTEQVLAQASEVHGRASISLIRN